MKIIIPDLHGRYKAHERIVKEYDSSIQRIYLGDFFDSFTEPNTAEILNIISSAIQRNDILIMGNHDEYYFSGNPWYHNSGYTWQTQAIIDNYFSDHGRENIIKSFRYFHRIGKTLFSHAGLTNEWRLTSYLKDTDDMLEDLNLSQIRNIIWSRPPFEGGVYFNISPTWARPQKIGENGYFLKSGEIEQQIFGHSPYFDIPYGIGQNLTCLDSKLFHYGEFDENTEELKIFDSYGNRHEKKILTF